MPARRIVNFLVARLPAPAQKLAVTALHRVASRWPALMRIVGMVPRSAHANGVAPTVVPDVIADAAARKETLVRLRSAGDYADRARAAASLAHSVDDETTAALAAALRDPSAEVAAQAAEALGHHRNAVATAALLAALENRDGFVYSPEARASAVRALGGLLPENEGGVIAVAVADLDATVSLSAIAALADRDEPASARSLILVLEDRAGFYLPLTRQAAARALLRLKDCDKHRIHKLLESESDATVREELQVIASR
jgi:HEAT repeat protein